MVMPIPSPIGIADAVPKSPTTGAAALGAPFGVIVACTFVFLSCAGLSFPCVQVTALAPHGAEAGTAAALLGAINFGLASAAAPVVGLFGTASAIPMGLGMGITISVALVLLWVVVRPLRSTPIGDDDAVNASAGH